MKQNYCKKINEKYEACLILHALGDTIGFKNGDWEFNNGLTVDSNYSNDLLYEFINLGGINDINLEGWIVSDDTIMHMETCKGLLEEMNDPNKFGTLLTKKYIECMKNMANRLPGIKTVENLSLLNKGLEWYKLPYDYMAGGSGASMRTSCIGLAFYKENELDKLISFSIEAGRITHNSVIGYMGGLISALFTSYAVRNIRVEEWIFLLIKLFESNKIDDYIKNTRGYDDYVKDKIEFIGFFQKYIALRFKGKFLNNDMSMRIPKIRTEFFYEHFGLKPNLLPGFLGHDSILVAYDALVSSNGNWETLVVYSMIHAGDSDSTGCIAASWFGALYGFKNIPDNNLKFLEYKKELKDLGYKLYNNINN